MKSWIYKLPKEKLVGIADVYGVDNAGTLDEVRRRMSAYIDDHPEEFMCERGDSSTTLAPPLISINTPEPQGGLAFPLPAFPDDDGRVMDKIRKWGCHFDGRDPAAFLERIRELQNAYRITGAQLFRGLPEILKGSALLWYRNFQEGWRTWTDFETAFRRFYFPQRYAAALRREVANRYQQSGEKFEPYAAALLTLMRRAGGFTPAEQLDMMYDHMRPEYKRYVRLDDVVDIIELQSRAAEHEEIEQSLAEEKKREKHPTGPAVAAVYNRRECCWRCKQRGHTRFQCQRPARKFCSRCGKDGVLTKDCHPPGNPSGDGATSAAATAPGPL